MPSAGDTGGSMDVEPPRLHAVAAEPAAPLVDPEDDENSLDGEAAREASLAVERRIAVSAMLTSRTGRPGRAGWPGGAGRAGWAGWNARGIRGAGSPDVGGAVRRPSRKASKVFGRPMAEHVPAAAPLLEVFGRQHPDADAELEWLRRSYQVAEFLHGDQRRRSGAPY